MDCDYGHSGRIEVTQADEWRRATGIYLGMTVVSWQRSLLPYRVRELPGHAYGHDSIVLAALHVGLTAHLLKNQPLVFGDLEAIGNGACLVDNLEP